MIASMVEGCPAPETIDALLAAQLDAAAAAKIEAHLDTCSNCRVLVGQLAKDSVYDRKPTSNRDSKLATDKTMRPGAAMDETVRPDVAGTDETMSPELGASETLVDRPDARVTADSDGRKRISRPSIRPMKIGRYLVDRKLGAGGMGIVFLADDPELKRSVVIKLLRAELSAEEDRARLLREAQAMAKVSHANVVPIYDVGLHDGQVFLAMEFIDGQDLAAWLKEPRTVREVIDVFVAAGRGLAAAHRAGLVHRDFKPHNVMLSNAGEVKVTDFGLARADSDERAAATKAATPRERDRKKRPRVVPRDSQLGAATLLESPLTHTGMMVGTPAYMAPEQILGEAVDARTDQFSFCIALYEALYGERPFRGQTATELFDSTLDGKLPELVAGGRRVPSHVRAAVRRGLSVDPEERFSSMDALLAAIAPRSRRGIAIAAGVAAAALASAGVVLAFGGSSESSAVCTGATAELAGVWNPQRQATIERAFIATDSSAGPSTFRAVRRDVDRYAQTWQGEHRQACEATRVRGEQTEQLMDRRMQCLRRRRAEVDALLDVLAKPDGEMLTEAIASVTRLPSPATCSNVEALASTAPADPRIASEVERLEAALAKARAQMAASRFDEAEPELVRLAGEAEKVGHTPLVAELQLDLGTVAITQLQWPEARKRLDRAVEVAEQAGADRIRAAAYLRLITTAAADQKLDEADRWARYAQATIDRLGKDRAMLAELDRRVGEVLKLRGDVKQAETTLRRAIERLTAVHGAASREVAVGYEELASLYDSADDHQRAFEAYGNAIKAYRAALGPNSAEEAGALSSQAMIRYYQGRYDEAVAIGEQELAMTRAYFGDEHIVTAQGYQLHSLQLQGVKRDDEAIAMMKRAVEISAKKATPEVHATAIGTLAVLYNNLGRVDEAAEQFAKALDAKIAVFGEDHVDVVTILNALGTMRRKQKRFDDAIALHERARSTLAKIHSPDSTLMADTLTRIGSVHLARGAPVDSVNVLEEALALRKAGNAAPASSSWTKLELAKALDARGDRKRAVTLAREAAAEAEAAGDQGQLDDAKQWLAGHGG